MINIFIILLFYYFIILSFYYFIILLFYYFIILLFYIQTPNSSSLFLFLNELFFTTIDIRL
jgi:hypothetical protein